LFNWYGNDTNRWCFEDQLRLSALVPELEHCI